VVFVVVGLAVTVRALQTPGAQHLLHLMSPPSDLYAPILSEPFRFDELGYARSYPLDFKYVDFYDISIRSDLGLPEGPGFSGKLLLELLHADSVIEQTTVVRPSATVFCPDGGNVCEAILHTVALPLAGRYQSGVYLRITVVDADKRLRGEDGDTLLNVSVSGIP